MFCLVILGIFSLEPLTKSEFILFLLVFRVTQKFSEKKSIGLLYPMGTTFVKMIF